MYKIYLLLASIAAYLFILFLFVKSVKKIDYTEDEQTDNQELSNVFVGFDGIMDEVIL